MEKVGHQYVFDADKAIDNQKKVKKGFDGIDKSAGDAGKQSQKGFELSSWAVAKGMAIYNIGLGLLRKGVAALNENMPFMGQAFDMAGKILMANLLYPLARELMPAVMEFFGWVRDHRIDFVQLGTLLVSVFRIVKSTITSAFGLVKAFWNGLMDGIGQGQITLKGFIDFMNLVLLKIAFVFTFLGIMLKPLFAMIGQGLGFLWKNALSPFIEGFVSGFMGQIAPLLSDFNEAIQLGSRLMKLLGISSNNNLTPMQKAFKFLGFVIGTAVIAPLRLLINLPGLFLKAFEAGVNGIGFLLDKADELDAWFRSIPNRIFDSIMRIPAFFKNIWETVKLDATKLLSSIFDDGGLVDKVSNWIREGFAKGWEAIKNSDVGKMFGSIASRLPGRASGGRTERGQPYKVGENGEEELFIPDQAGRVAPIASSPRTLPAGSGGSPAVFQDNRQMHFDIKSTDPREAAREVAAIQQDSQPNFRGMQHEGSMRYA